MQNEQRSLWPLLIGAAIAFYAFGLPGLSNPLVPPPPADSLEAKMVLAFRTNDNRSEAAAHAHVFGTICTSLAECIEYDGTRKEPLIKAGVQIDDLRFAMRQTRMKGWSFLPKYPDLGPAVDAFLTSRVGTSGQPIDAAKRAAWVTAFRELGQAAEAASKRG